ncbi:COP9 signalosome catalytic subunit rri1 [Entomophthora muscae]|uniref:COP9 signalosome catalytic subunit rri1 n=1 Tax=Entomophthora muscae TaxID=34485 RepID=A0ACC2RUB1_9FUNG|nr:COP9 signalosome catalytic subunit rri1 [Entomophthora muscae]
MIDESAALKNFEFENNIIEIKDDLFCYDNAQQQALLNQKPWKADPRYFTIVKVSAKALIKMITHARSGGNIEVMGLLLGKIVDRTMIIVDVFALPVEGTETRVNAQAEGNEYMIQYLDQIREVSRNENAIGWYHSHPGYGCWLSGIDVNTQMLNQQFQEPFLAVVIDPVRSVSAGKVEIGAFRTFPAGFAPTAADSSDFQAVPIDKIEDFGVHANQYYPLEITYFKSALDTLVIDQLWSKYWVNTLSQSTLFSNRDFFSRQLQDVQKKISSATSKIQQRGVARTAAEFYFPESESDIEKRENRKKPYYTSALSKTSEECAKATSEATHAVISELLKQALFGLPSARSI